VQINDVREPADRIKLAFV